MKHLFFSMIKYTKKLNSGMIIFLIHGFQMKLMVLLLSFQGKLGINLIIAVLGQITTVRHNGKLGLLLNKDNPNIWWFIELIKSENTHFTLEYHRIIGNKLGQRGFAVRKRHPDDIERDLNLENLKNRFLKHEIDENELNRRASYLMHDHSVKRKFKISNINYSQSNKADDNTADDSQSNKADDNTQSWSY